jgi:hypothetical protein
MLELPNCTLIALGSTNIIGMVNALEQMINVFYGYRKMGLQEMQTMGQATKILRRT